MIILVNGPPGSGKDTIGHILSFYFHAQVTKFAKYLKDKAHALYGFPGVKHDAFEDVKDEPQACLYGKTWREIYIALSEEFYKPLYGKDFFGRILADEIAEDGGELYVVTDSGFMEEAGALIEALEEDHDFHLIRVIRPGCDFEKDSRGPVYLPFVPTSEIHNRGSMDDLVRLTKTWGRKYLEEIDAQADS